jgi:hypothetical protein
VLTIAANANSVSALNVPKKSNTNQYAIITGSLRKVWNQIERYLAKYVVNSVMRKQSKGGYSYVRSVKK